MDEKRIYLACPYSHHEWMVRDYRVEQATKCAAKLLEYGYLVYSPLTHTANMAKYLPEKVNCEWEFWKEISFTFVDWADEIWILTMSGWDESTGVSAEVMRATSQSKNIEYCTVSSILDRTHPRLMVN